MLTIALAQMNPTVGDFDANCAAIIARMQRASEEGADLLVCPELSLCAYYPGDLFEDAAFLRGMQQALDTVLQASTRWPELVTVIGTARPNSGVGKPLYNALLACATGNVEEYYKHCAHYGIFDAAAISSGSARRVHLGFAGCKVAS